MMALMGGNMGENQQQADYWSDAPGRKWITFEDALDEVFASVNELLLNRAKPQPGDAVLDIGCGTGATTLDFARRVAPNGRLTAVDISPPLLSRARSRVADAPVPVHCQLADAQTDAIAGAPFDLVISRFGVMFFADPVAAFANLRAHLAPGGRLCVAAWAPMAENPWFDVPCKAATQHLGPPDKTPPNAPGPLGFQDIAHVTGLLRRAGLTGVEGRAVPITLRHAGRAGAAAALASNIGPAARILKKYQGTEDDIAAIRGQVLQAYRAYETSAGTRIPAVLNLFTAQA